MANKKSKKSKKSASHHNGGDSNVVRIRAGGSSAPDKHVEEAEIVSETVATKVVANTPKTAKKVKKTKEPSSDRSKSRVPRILRSAGGYFKGAWVELRQVRWPNRRATWSLTAAVLAYTAFFVVIVLVLDAGFKYLFELILGK